MTSTETQAQTSKVLAVEDCPEAGNQSKENSAEYQLATLGDKMAPEQSPSKPLQDSQSSPQPVSNDGLSALPKQTMILSVHQSTNIQSQVHIEQQLSKAKRDLESMVIRYAKSESDNLQNKTKVEELERKLKRAIKDNDSLANRVKILTNDKNHLSDSLSAKVAQLTVLEQKNCSLNSDQRDRLGELESKVAELETRNEELLKQIDTYKSKEADLLDFSERLSMKQLLLQTELDKALENVPNYRLRYEQMVSASGELEEKMEELSQQLAQATSNLEIERKRNGTLSEERLQLEVKCRRQIEELENEIKLVRRKCQIATKELLKRIRQYEPDYPG